MTGINVLTICVLLAWTSDVRAVQNVTLDGAWNVVNSNQSIKITGTVPGSIYSDLRKAGKLGDIYFRFNDVEYRWVARETWTYSRTFTVTKELLDHDVVQIYFGGLDTIGDIELNDKSLGKTDNMFRKYRFDVKDHLKEGSNSIKVTFTSPVIYAWNQSESYPYKVPPVCPGEAQHGECQPNFIRKEQCSFSWDWGPSFPTVGIWKNVKLVAYSTAAIQYTTVHTTQASSGDWLVSGVVHLDVNIKPGVSGVPGVVYFNIGKLNSYQIKVNLQEARSTVSYQFVIPKTTGVQAWWPNGYGSQTMYTMWVMFRSTSQKQEEDSKAYKIGFRTVELVQEPIEGSEGLSFYFKINGVPVFMKGSNWIPADSLQERITEDYLRKLLGSAKLANMNMLRVWGGGIYESEMFYNIASEYGIMIWQDFMFACALYPTGKDYLENVREEVTHQVLRLQNKPAIALWAGNNENEIALAGYKVKPDYEKYYKDYVSLYIDVIRDVVVSHDTSRPFVPSSPSNGIETEQEKWVAKNPQDTHYGDIHHYDYESDGWNWTTYPVPRFASEFGIEAWCSYENLENVSAAGDLSWSSNFSLHRQHHPGGNDQMLAQVTRHMNEPTTGDPSLKFKQLIYLTQINQAMGIRTEAELYLRSQSEIVKGNGHTMGALYWQLDDIWQAPTWASIEYGGRWKMLHYYAKRFYSNRLLSPYIDGDKLVVYYVHNGREPEGELRFGSSEGQRDARHASRWQASNGVGLFGMNQKKRLPQIGEEATLIVTVFSWDSLTPKKTVNQQFTVSEKSAVKVYESSVKDLYTEANCGSDKCFFQVALSSTSAPLISDEPINWLLPIYPKNTKGMMKARIEIHGVAEIEMGQFEIALQTNAIAAFVWLEARGVSGRFSDNGFMMTAEKENVYFYTWDSDTTSTQLQHSLSVMSLMDLY